MLSRALAVSVSGESLLRAVRYAMAEHGLADAPATVAHVRFWSCHGRIYWLSSKSRYSR